VHRDSRKKPVLTSPWKMGMLVALLLVAIGIGSGYYVVRIYDVDLPWFTFDGERWSLDSFMFFREMYILVAAIVTVSLISYFFVASAVRRYKFYLDSGQDYRKMIALADSIDDLTNPAQIARLSDYPELQTVLRNYGDQIREVSEELEQRGREQRSIDLEMEIESLLRGEPVEDTLVEGKWWAPIFKRLEKYTNDNRQIIADIEGRIEQIRGIFCGAVLTTGKVMEAVSSASEDLIEITRIVGELTSISNELKMTDRDDSTGDIQPASGRFDSAIARIESSMQRLEQGGRMMNDFSEENNSLALSIALTAAKGSTSDKDIAQYAEKARTTAERFKKLNADIMGIVGDLLEGCRALRQGTGSVRIQGGTGSPDVHSALSEIVWRIEQRSKSLHQKMIDLKNELEDTNELLQRGLSKLDVVDTTTRSAEESDGREETKKPGDASIVNFGAGADDECDDESALVIEHGRLWEDEHTRGEYGASDDVLESKPECEAVEESTGDGKTTFAPTDKYEFGHADEERGSLAVTEPAAEEAAVEEDDPVSREDACKTPAPVDGDSWMKMPGHRWLKVDVEKSEHEQAENVEVKEGKSADDEAVPVEESPAGEKEAAMCRDASDMEEAATYNADNDPIVDLFELGAVEYVEETQRH
jgi:hypothetical protein